MRFSTCFQRAPDARPGVRAAPQARLRSTLSTQRQRAVALALLALAAATVPMASAAPPVWDDTNSISAAAPENRRGGNPGYESAPWNPSLGSTGGQLEDDGGAMSGNYRLSLPILGFPGRGGVLQLGIHYSSQLWARLADRSLVFDPDGDWPAPGWSIGFGKLVVTQGSAAVLIRPDNTRETLYQRNPIGGAVRYMGIVGNATASIDICCMGVGADQGRTATVRDGRGQAVEYVTSTPGARQAVYFPLQATDANGNKITIKYVLDAAKHPAPPAIDYITDSVGRNIRFHYDQAQHLVSITAPGLDREHRVYARFLYTSANVSVGVGQACTPYNRTADFLTGVVLPGTNVGYWLAPPNRYGMSTWALETRGVRLRTTSMKAPATLLSQGTETKRTTFDYPDAAATSCLGGPPAYASKTEEWDDPVSADKKLAVTHYVQRIVGGDTLMTVTLPDGAISRQFVSNDTNASKFTVAGQVRRIENANAAGTVLSSTDFEWQSQVPMAYGAPRQQAVIQNIDPLAVSNRISFDYDASNPLLVTNEFHYGYGVAGLPVGVEWATRTTYLQDPAYAAARLVGLPQSVQRFDGIPAVSKAVSRTDFEYDGTPLTPVGPLRQHSADYEPHNVRVCEKYETDTRSGKPRQVCVKFKETPAAWVTKRGNLTKVIRFADAAGGSGPVATNLRYDTTGNLLQRTDDGGNGWSYAYDPGTYLSLPSIATAGATSPTSPFRISTTFSYHLGAGLARSTTDAAGRVVQYTYAPGPSGWRQATVSRPDGTKQSYGFNDTGLWLQTSLTDPANKVHQLVMSRFDGRGQLRSRITSLGSDMSLVDTEYDAMGRISRQSLPHSHDQVPTWSATSYDALGRVVSLTSNGEASTVFSYDENTAPPASLPRIPILQGTTVRTTDAWGRQRWMQRDISGNPRYLVEPNPDTPNDIFAANAQLTEYHFDPTGLPQSIVSGPQVRRFVHDGLGRLTAQALPERNASLDVTGVYDGTASSQKYSDVFQYDNRANLVVSIDARGVRTVRDYCLPPHSPASPCPQYDPFNRVQAIHYEIPPAADTSSEILPAPGATLHYGTGADQLRVENIDVDGVVAYANTYDSLGRPVDLTTTLAAYPSMPLTLTLGYDSIARVNTLTYPARYGSGNARRAFTFGYDGDALSHVDLDGTPLVSDITFEAGGRAKSLTLSTGAGPIKEVFDIDPALGLPSARTATDANGVRRLALEYRYRRQSAGVNGRSETPGIVGSLTAVRDLLDDEQTQDFGYDVLGRLAWASTGDSMRAVFDPLTVSWQGYGYDRFGNRTTERAYRQVVGHAGCAGGCATIELDEAHHDGVSSLTYDASTNRITSPGYAYDAAGNLTHGMSLVNGAYDARTYQYDAAGRLGQVLLGNNGSLLEAYRYGFGNRRLATSPDGVAWDYLVWMGDKIVSKFSAPGQQAAPVWSESTYYLGNRLIATEVPDGNSVAMREHFDDQRGVTATFVQKNGVAQFARQATRPFGTESATQLDWWTTRRFTSYDRAGLTGNDNAVNRVYVPGQGRFLQTDPAGISAIAVWSPQSLNAYAYAGNDPINQIDPSGLFRIPAGCAQDRDEKGRLAFEADGRPKVVCGGDDTIEVTASPMFKFPAFPTTFGQNDAYMWVSQGQGVRSHYVGTANGQKAAFAVEKERVCVFGASTEGAYTGMIVAGGVHLGLHPRGSKMGLSAAVYGGFEQVFLSPWGSSDVKAQDPVPIGLAEGSVGLITAGSFAAGSTNTETGVYLGVNFWNYAAGVGTTLGTLANLVTYTGLVEQELYGFGSAPPCAP